VNAVANLCETVGADVRDVLLGMAYDHRIGFDYLRPGPGWGGSCLPKDTRALLFMAEGGGYDFPLLREVIETNETQLSTVMTKIRHSVGGSLAGAAVAAWGLTFKARTDDRRDSPAVDLVQRMLAEGAQVRVFDPTVTGPIPEFPTGVEICGDAYAACDGAAAVVVLTEWEELRWLDFSKVRTLLAEPSVVDARNLLDPTAMRRMGFTYVGVGRP
jgi:UDPglucose 6-dehydrogenase